MFENPEELPALVALILFSVLFAASVFVSRREIVSNCCRRCCCQPCERLYMNCADDEYHHAPTERPSFHFSPASPPGSTPTSPQVWKSNFKAQWIVQWLLLACSSAMYFCTPQQSSSSHVLNDLSARDSDDTSLPLGSDLDSSTKVDLLSSNTNRSLARSIFPYQFFAWVVSCSSTDFTKLCSVSVSTCMFVSSLARYYAVKFDDNVYVAAIFNQSHALYMTSSKHCKLQYFSAGIFVFIAFV